MFSSQVVVTPKVEEPQVNLQKKHMPEIVAPCEDETSSGAAPVQRETKKEDALVSGGHQYSVVHTSPNYNFGFVPQIIGSQTTLLDNSESQTRDISRLPSFVVRLEPCHCLLFF